MRLTIGGRTVGELKYGTLIKTGKQVQKFSIFDGFGIAKELLNDERINSLEFHYRNNVYKISARDAKRYGIPYQHPKFEPQVIIPIKDMLVYDANQLRLV